MSASNSRMSYEDCFALFERASEEDRGIKISCETYGEARNLKMRLHYARKLDRRDNAEIYPEDHPMHGRSIYDNILCRMKNGQNGKAYIVLEKMTTKAFIITALTDEDE